MTLKQQAQSVKTQHDLAQFLNSLSENFKSAPQTWENSDICTYLEAVAAWVEDMDGYYQNQGLDVPPQPSWQVMAETFLAARTYE